MKIQSLKNKLVDYAKEEVKKEEKVTEKDILDYKKLQNMTEHKGENVDVYA
jgi:galactose-1-phosphate uridylyltransferase